MNERAPAWRVFAAGSDGAVNGNPAPNVRASQHRRNIAVITILCAAIVLVFTVTMVVGDYSIAVGDVLTALNGKGDASAEFVVLGLRLPRAICAILAGTALGLSGSMLQALARNTLASPDIIGIEAGASVVAVYVIVNASATGVTTAAGAQMGALGTGIIIYVLAYRRGMAPQRLVLVGVGIGAVISAITSYLLTRADVHDAQRAVVWLTGSLNGRTWTEVGPLALQLVALVPMVMFLARPLAAMQLGEELARGLGVPVQRVRGALLLVVVGLAASSTAAVGPVAFVAFCAGPIAKRLVRAPIALAASGLTGALLLLGADLVARRVIAPVELPVGIVTGILGAPYLLWLVLRSKTLGSLR